MGIFPLKGLCHEMNKFFEGLKNQISTFWSCADGFYFFLQHCYGENRSIVWLASVKTLFKILPETLFKMVVAAFRKPPVILKSNIVTLFKNNLNFTLSSPAYGTF
jgi:hypothetical protein